MLVDIILDGLDELTPETQRSLLSLAAAQKNYVALAKLALVTNLLPEIDDKLELVGAAVVRAAWIQRPGRSLERVTESLKRERRVSVLQALAGLELEPECYALIAKANNSVTIALAVLGSKFAPLEAKQIAATNLAGALNAGKGQKYQAIRDALAVNGEVMEAFANAAADPLSITIVAQVDTLSDPVATGIVNRLETLFLSFDRRIDAINDKKDSWQSTYEIMGEGHRLVTAAGDFAARSWCDEPKTASILAMLSRTKSAVGESAVAHQYYSRVSHLADNLAHLIEVLEHQNGNPTGAFEFVNRAGAITTLEEVNDLLESIQVKSGLQSGGVRKPDVIYSALLRNPQLELPAMIKVVEVSTTAVYEVCRSAVSLAEYPVTAWIAITMKLPWAISISKVVETGRLEEYLDGLKGQLPHMPQSSVERILGSLIGAGVVNASLLRSLPVTTLQLALTSTEVPATVRHDVAVLLEGALRGLPDSVWLLAGQLAEKFTGTIDELVLTARAAAT